MLFLWYPPCSTCKKAKAFLDAAGASYEGRNIKEQNPTREELKVWTAASGLPLQRWFNTSGQLYRAMNLKEKLPSMTDEEKLDLLATDGMLVKRPVLVGDGFVLVGFREEQWKELLGL